MEEDAPVEIGGQSPVPKRFALDDLALAAEKNTIPIPSMSKCTLLFM